MAVNGILSDLLCAISENEHFIEEPIALTNCGHCVCWECLPNQQNPSIKCLKCGAITNRDLRNDKKSITSILLKELSLKDLFIELEKRLNNQYNKLLDQIDCENLKIISQIEYVENAIESRIDSLKVELDNLLMKFRREIKSIKFKLLESNESSTVLIQEVDFYKTKLDELKNYNQSGNKGNLDTFNEYNQFLKKINQSFKELDRQVFELKFEPSNYKINEEMIGRLVYYNYNYDDILNDNHIRSLLKDSKYEITQLSVAPYDICVLPNNKLLTANGKTLTLYDENLKLIKTIDKIGDDQSIDAIGVTTNKLGEIYILSYVDCCIHKTDLKFNLIKSVGSHGSGSCQLMYPYGIDCENGCVYVSDQLNKRIQIFDLDLNYFKSVQLNYNPIAIKILNNIICVNGSHFYDIDDNYSLIKSYEKDSCKISVIDANFYIIKPKKFQCFDKNGEIIEVMIEIKWLNDFIKTQWDGCIEILYNKLIISSVSKKQLISFNLV